MSKNHYVYKCTYCTRFLGQLVVYRITAYSCGDYYIKRLFDAPESRSRRVTKSYLRICFPEWYKSCGLFHVEY